MDLVGTASIAFDIPWLGGQLNASGGGLHGAYDTHYYSSEHVGGGAGGAGTDTEGQAGSTAVSTMLIARAGRAARVAARAARIVRFFRSAQVGRARGGVGGLVLLRVACCASLAACRRLPPAACRLPPAACRHRYSRATPPPVQVLRVDDGEPP